LFRGVTIWNLNLLYFCVDRFLYFSMIQIFKKKNQILWNGWPISLNCAQFCSFSNFIIIQDEPWIWKWTYRSIHGNVRVNLNGSWFCIEKVPILKGYFL
jgi:hypothetical protein